MFINIITYSFRKMFFIPFAGIVSFFLTFYSFFTSFVVHGETDWFHKLQSTATVLNLAKEDYGLFLGNDSAKKPRHTHIFASEKIFYFTTDPVRQKLITGI